MSKKAPNKKTVPPAPMHVETVPITSIFLDPANARKHPERNLTGIQASLQRFGQQKPLVVDGKGIIRAGNGTYAAAKALGWKTIQIVRTKLCGADAIAYALADNRLSDLSEWDVEALGEQFAGLDEDLKGIAGFTEDEMSELLAEVSPAGTPETNDKGHSIPEAFQVVVECQDEDDQQKVYEQMVKAGYKCRVLTM